MIVNKNGTGLYENNYLINREIKNCCQNFLFYSRNTPTIWTFQNCVIENLAIYISADYASIK